MRPPRLAFQHSPGFRPLLRPVESSFETYEDPWHIFEQVSMCEVIPSFLYLGARTDADNAKGLRDSRINYILCVASELIDEPWSPKTMMLSSRDQASAPANTITRKCVPIDDTDADPTPWFAECFAFIEKAYVNRGRILVHCNKGISRAPTIVMAYLIQFWHFTFRSALRFIKIKRHIVNPRLSFLMTLEDLSEKVRGTTGGILGLESPSTTHPVILFSLTPKFAATMLAPTTPNVSSIETPTTVASNSHPILAGAVAPTSPIPEEFKYFHSPIQCCVERSPVEPYADHHYEAQNAAGAAAPVPPPPPLNLLPHVVSDQKADEVGTNGAC